MGNDQYGFDALFIVVVFQLVYQLVDSGVREVKCETFVTPKKRFSQKVQKNNLQKFSQLFITSYFRDMTRVSNSDAISSIFT